MMLLEIALVVVFWQPVMKELELDVHVRVCNVYPISSTCGLCELHVHTLLLTEPPQAPNSMAVSAASARNIVITWSPPAQTGGRSDLYYTVEHSDPDRLGQYIGTTCKGSSSTSHTFTGLRPDTQYCIRVSAHNGVSDQDPDGAHLRTAEECTTTSETCESLSQQGPHTVLSI